ncbi:MAG: YrrS family protein [Bacillus sp. (in: firmicutes)]
MRDDKPSRLTSRSEKVGKKRKANTVYNILLTIVIVAIIIVSASIFLGKDDKETATPNKENKSQQVQDDEKETAKDDEDTTNGLDQDADDEKTNDPEKTDEEDTTDEDKEDSADVEKKPEEDDRIVENSGNPSVEETRVNESWEPIGTEQTGEHVTTYTQGTTDWNEMEKALAYGAGIDQSGMTVLWLGNGGAPDKAEGTVLSKGDGSKYKVYIQWVDGQGWKPTKVEKLK